MKKSNKILLGGILLIVVILLSINAALNARYKSGHYALYNDAMANQAMQVKEFSNAGKLDIRFLHNVHIRSGQRLRVEHYGNEKADVSIIEKGGTVYLEGKNIRSSESSELNYDFIIIYVPNNCTIDASKASLILEGQKGPRMNSLAINASESRVMFNEAKPLLQIDSLHIAGLNKSFLDLQNTQIEKLAVRLNASELRDQDAVINQFMLEADSASQVNLQTKNLLKLTAKTTAHE